MYVTKKPRKRDEEKVKREKKSFSFFYYFMPLVIRYLELKNNNLILTISYIVIVHE
jgi:hypothetical protein